MNFKLYLLPAALAKWFMNLKYRQGVQTGETVCKK